MMMMMIKQFYLRQQYLVRIRKKCFGIDAPPTELFGRFIVNNIRDFYLLTYLRRLF